MRDDKALALRQEYGILPETMVERLASLLRAQYKPPKRRNNETDEQYALRVVQPEEFEQIIYMAYAEGHNPLSKSFHYYKMNGALTVQDHYANLVAWGQSVEPFNYRFERVSGPTKSKEGTINAASFVVRCIVVKRADQGAYREFYRMILDSLLGARVDADKAIEQATSQVDQRFASVGEGVVEFGEVYYENGKEIYGATPKGRTPGWWKAEKRALTDALNKSHGMIPAAARFQMSFGNVDVERLPAYINGIPADDTEFSERYVRLEAENDRLQRENENLTVEERKARRGKNVEMMRQPKDEDDWLDEATVDPPEEEEDPFPPTGDDVVEGEISEIVSGVDGEGNPVAKTSDLDKLSGPISGASGSGLTAEEVLEAYGYKGNVGSAKNVLLRFGYKGEVSMNGLLASIFGPRSTVNDIEKLTSIQLANMFGYAERRSMLEDSRLGSVDERLESIPEIATATPEGRPKTIKDAKAYLKQVAVVFISNGKVLKPLV
jgi:hypothetical protein